MTVNRSIVVRGHFLTYTIALNNPGGAAITNVQGDGCPAGLLELHEQFSYCHQRQRWLPEWRDHLDRRQSTPAEL